MVAAVHKTWMRWRVVVSLALLLILLALYSARAIDRNLDDLRHLSSEELPLFDGILELRTALVNVESSVYEFYLTTEDAPFEQRYRSQIAIIEHSVSDIQAKLGESEALENIAVVSEEIKAKATEFQDVMTREQIDWDLARDVLSEVAPLTGRAIRESEALAAWVRERVEDQTEVYSRRMRNSVYLVLFLNALAFVAAIGLFLAHLSRLRAVREQKRLASFPSSNPYPVMSLGPAGELRYANAAASAACNSDNVLDILPSNIADELDQGAQYREWEYERDGRWFMISMGWLEEHREYHVYISETTERKKAESQLEYLAYHDPVTGLSNRQSFLRYIDEHQSKRALAVAILDLGIQNTVAAIAGVKVAEEVAALQGERLSKVFEQDTRLLRGQLSSLGGGLFGIAFYESDIDLNALFLLLNEAVSRPLDAQGFEFYLGLNMGVVESSHTRQLSSDEILRRADGALSEAIRDAGRMLVVYQTEIEARAQQRIEMERGLRQALENEEFELFYQPKIDLQSGRVAGAEALLRWRHPEKGFVSPAEFIPVAEESGQILEIGRWVLNRAAEDVEMWNTGQRELVSVAVNISAKQLLHTDLGAVVLAAAERNDIPVNWMELEITETAALSDFDKALERLEQLTRLGIQLSLDDFGTGYSSLSYLQRLPVKTLKIDRSFVQALRPGSKDESLVEAIINMARQLSLYVVAEGVETEEQLQMLKDWRCQSVQGFLLARPMPLDDFIEFKQQFTLP